jgi:hypothetical protein
MKNHTKKNEKLNLRNTPAIFMGNDSTIAPTPVIHVDGLKRAQAKGSTHQTCIIHRPTEEACIRRREKKKAYSVVLTYDSPTKTHLLPQTTCQHPYIVHDLGDVMLRSSQTRRHWLHYPAPSLGYLRVPGCTDVNLELRQYREGHLAVDSTM